MTSKKPWADFALPKKDQLVRVSVINGAKDGYLCAGGSHTVKPQTYPADRFTQEQLWKLSRDHFIQMDYVDAPKPAKDEKKS